MARDDAQRTIEGFAVALADLRNHAGKPSFARIQNLSKLRATDFSAGRAISLPSTTASDAIRGKRLPSIATVLAFVDACRRAAAEDGMVVDASRFDLSLWQQRWREVRDLRDADTVPTATASVGTGDSGLIVEPEDEEPVRAVSPAVDVRALITSYAQSYAHEVDAFFPEPRTHRRDLEQRSLEKLHDLVSLALEGYDPPSTRRARNNLVLADLYFEADSVVDVASMSEHPAPIESRPAVPAEYFAALLAAEVEFHGPVRLNYTEKALLADLYERVGEWMLKYQLFTHAEFAYKRAAIVHYQNEETTDQERCQIASARAHRNALPPGLISFSMVVVDLLCGYGYQPIRMLGWIVVEIAVFTLLLLLLNEGAVPAVSVIQSAIVNFFNPLGPNITVTYSPLAQLLFVIESFTGTLSSLIFAALVARKFLSAGRR